MKPEELLIRDQEAGRLGAALLGDAKRLLHIDFEEDTLQRIHRAVKFQGCCEDAADLFLERNAVYGDAFVQIGVVGMAAELIGCLNRLKVLVLRRSERMAPWNSPQEKDLLRDILRDAHNFSNICRMMLDEDNWNGRG